MRIRAIVICGIIFLGAICAFPQTAGQGTMEQRVPLTELAVALDAKGGPALEGRLRTTGLRGAPDNPVSDIQLVIKNVSPLFYNYVSGVVTFYDDGGVRCGEGLFKADALSANESFEVDSPGARVRCSAVTWRIVVTNLVTRSLEQISNAGDDNGIKSSHLVISVDGEEHPIQLEKPMVLTLGDKQRTIVVRQNP